MQTLVKIFRNNIGKKNDNEERVNEWLNEQGNNIEIVDIKFTSSLEEMYSESILIIYEVI